MRTVRAYQNGYTIVCLEEQLAALPADAPRFVVVEAPYGNYCEQGYACYDRERRRFTNHKDAHVGGWNNVFQQRSDAEKVCDLCNADAPQKYAYHPEFARVLAEGNANDDYVAYSEPKPLAAPEETEFVTTSPYKIGDEITEQHGYTYIAIENSYYISEKDAADAEDMDAFHVSVGYHTKARLKK